MDYDIPTATRIEHALACGNYGLAYRLLDVLRMERGEIPARFVCTVCGRELDAEPSGSVAAEEHECRF